MSISKYISESEAETRKIAAEFAKKLRGDEKICLVGPLGSGKTTFVRGFVEAFGISSANVQSPTFTLIREYVNHRTVYHIDLYRLEKEEDIFEAGIFDVITSSALVLIEWADRLEQYYPAPSILVRFEQLQEGRAIEIL